jgi:hypothetical protein
LEGLHLRSQLGDCLSQEEFLMLDLHQSLLEGLVLLFDRLLLAFKLLNFLSLALSG